MKPWGRFICIFLAYGIALLHTAIPHHHLQSSDGQVVLVHKGCALAHGQGGLLQRVFSTDLGIGHLETFKKSSDAQLEFSPGFVSIMPPVPSIDFVASQIKAFPEFISGYIEKLSRQRLLFSTNTFRAPPLS